MEPARKKAPVTVKEARPRREPTAEVRRQVWKRDGGRCAWVGPDGRRCESRWQLEYDHVHPAALGGAATVDNGRLLCRAHQLISAEQTFGRAHMEKCRRGSRKGESASAGESASRRPSCELLLFGREHVT
jgi:5-methylcytosine-specific restriction endonuclease McrA